VFISLNILLRLSIILFSDIAIVSSCERAFTLTVKSPSAIVSKLFETLAMWSKKLPKPCITVPTSSLPFLYSFKAVSSLGGIFIFPVEPTLLITPESSFNGLLIVLAIMKAKIIETTTITAAITKRIIRNTFASA
jgi:hypothetical protein